MSPPPNKPSKQTIYYIQEVEIMGYIIAAIIVIALLLVITNIVVVQQSRP